MNKLEVKDNRFYLDGSELEFLTEITTDKLSGRKARVSLSMVAKELKNYHPHMTVIITSEHIRVDESVIGVPIDGDKE